MRILGAQLLDGEAVDISIDNGTITQVVDAGRSAGSDQTIDADGLIALPGLVDLHTHLREPGREDAENVFTGSHTAARGGFTCVLALASMHLVEDTAVVVEQVYPLCAQHWYC